MMAQYSDSEVLEGIRAKDPDVMRYIYNQFYPMVRFFIIRNRGNDTDAQDVFQDAVLAIYERMRQDKFTLDSSLKTFIYSVCRHKWLQYLDRQKFVIDVEDLDNYLAYEDKAFYEDESAWHKWLFQKHYLRLSESCQQIIRMYLDRTNMLEVAGAMGYKNRQYAIKRKYECLRSLYIRIMSDPEYKRSIL